MSIRNGSVRQIARRAWWRVQAAVERIRYGYGGRGALCSVCGRASRRFAPYGDPPRPRARCIWCSSLERHRLVWLYFQRKTNILDGATKRMLHVAPEKCFERRLRRTFGSKYVTADLRQSGVNLCTNVMELALPDNRFDVVYCSHVLEEVPDDRRAMRELRRVLRGDGLAVLLVPLSGNERTLEDPSIISGADKKRMYGQDYNLRFYGADYPDRLREAGFAVERFLIGDLANEREARQMGLSDDGNTNEIYVCRRSGDRVN
jgi:SAM-dependent methyltransferase